MKSLFPILLISLLFCFSCSDDEVSADLKYDGDNFSAPVFDDVVFEAGSRFPATLTSAFVGNQLTDVEFYIDNIPASCELIIYDEGTQSSPGVVLYSANVANGLDSDAWNNHKLTTPVEISGRDLWICVKAEHVGSAMSIGCDAGPAVSNGDWLKYDILDWQSLREYSNDNVNINWNIRGFVSN